MDLECFDLAPAGRFGVFDRINWIHSHPTGFEKKLEYFV
jgi:hypothetical protein